VSAITPERAQRAIQSRFNPIRGLKPERLAQQLDQYDLGWLREPAILWDVMERRDPLIKNVAAKRRQAVSRAQWEVLTIGQTPEAMQQKEVLEVFYNNLSATSALKQNMRGGMGLLQRQMMDAVGKGFSVHDMTWVPLKGRGTQRSLNRRPSKGNLLRKLGPAQTSEGGPGFTGGEFLTATFTHCPLQFFENTTGRLRFLKSDYDMTGVEMKEAEWLVTCADPLMEATSIAYVYKHLPLKFWVGYAEKFGYPGVLAKTNAAQGTAEWTQAEQAVASFMNDWGAVVNLETILELIETKGGGSSGLPFPALVEYIDRMIASLWRGADLSTISQGAQGVGASLQGDETNLLQEDDAGLITETFWDQIDRLVLRYVLGVDEPLAYVKILPPKKQAVDQDIKIDEFLLRWGVELSVDDALERYGRGAAEEGEPVLQRHQTPEEQLAGAPSADGGATRTGQIENSLWQRVRKSLGLSNSITPEEKMRTAKRELMRPVMERLQAIHAMKDGDEQRAALIALQAELPRLKARMENEAGDGALAETLAEEMKAALVKGFSKKGTK
jgi:phage gp29-like protein